jgi:hypothetical protein
VFGNSLLRTIFGPEREETTGEWRKVLYNELYNLYDSLNVIRISKVRRMRWAGSVTCDKKCIQNFGLEI